MQSCDRATSPVATRRCMCLNISNSWRWRSGAIKHLSTISLQLSASSTCAGNAANAERVSQQREYTKTITGLLFLSCKSDTWILICADLQFVNPQSNRCRSLSDSKAVIFQFTHYLRNLRLFREICFYFIYLFVSNLEFSYRDPCNRSVRFTFGVSESFRWNYNEMREI